ncbi:hypothetical protein XELAEV_18035278mg [Xenopus laevis]|uniref:Uncharacterized protein n=1 Tax=Xenopus laevis TaxID=8355 RepID=A0A974HBZ0_XENLA|nr:hypothetical protein XELAEV_18035278mg [Xenopus laevis]
MTYYSRTYSCSSALFQTPLEFPIQNPVTNYQHSNVSYEFPVNRCQHKYENPYQELAIQEVPSVTNHTAIMSIYCKSIFYLTHPKCETILLNACKNIILNSYGLITQFTKPVNIQYTFFPLNIFTWLFI